MKILVVGGSGLLGIKLMEVLEKQNFEVYSTYHTNPIRKKNCFELEITKKDNVQNLINKIRPDVVIHTAAFINVDGCETNKDQAYYVNVEGTKNVAEAVNRNGAKLVYISTDYVFDGETGYYKENDLTNPINYYGQTKLEGEKVIEEICLDSLILRASVIYGSNKKNFATWILETLGREERINIVRDQFVSPTLNIDLAEQAVALIQADEQGIFHTAGGERISRYDFTLALADIFALDDNLINAICIEDLDWIARRPKDSSLNVSKVSKFKKPYKVKEAALIFREDLQEKI